MYWFILKSAFCVGVVLALLPEENANRVTSEVTRAVAQDRFVKAALERTQLAAQKAVAESQKLCLKNPDECLDAARQIARDATANW